jgi:hypothetical protein
VTLVVEPFEGIKPLIDGEPERVIWMMGTEGSLIANSQKRPSHGSSSNEITRQGPHSV